MTPVRFHNSVICSLLPGFAHASMAQPCKRETALAPATAENERLPCRMPRSRMGFFSLCCFHRAQPRGFRRQGGAESSQSEDERILDRQRQARLGADWQEAAREPEGLATALLTAWENERFFVRFF